MLFRAYLDRINDLIKSGKVLVLYGPRQVGKTTLLREYLKNTTLKYKMVSGEDIRIREVLESQSITSLQDFVSGYELLVIDEAQKIEQVGLALKLLVDHIPSLKIIATGSASFDLANKVGEPLTGRKRTRILYPLAQMEISKDHNPFELKSHLENYLIFGSYPEVLTQKNSQDKMECLNELSGSYIFKDILELERVKGAKVLFNLLKLLAFQIGKDVSLNELGKQLGLDYKTVGRYLDLLEKNFVIQHLGGFSRNLRKEISKTNRYYFLDTGIRNAIISNFNGLNDRSGDDIGQLWENFLFMERQKRNEYLRHSVNHYFWRTYDQKEIDLIEEHSGTLQSFEFKWGKEKVSAPKDFVKAYPEAKFELINQDNYLNFVL